MPDPDDPAILVPIVGNAVERGRADVADVFISYHVSSAADLVRQIDAELGRRGISCWYSEDRVGPGEYFAEKVPQEIDACRVFLLILDEGAKRSFHVKNEVHLAVQRRAQGGAVDIIPFYMLEGSLSGPLRYDLAQFQRVDGRVTPLEAPIREAADKIEEIVSRGDWQELKRLREEIEQEREAAAQTRKALRRAEARADQLQAEAERLREELRRSQAESKRLQAEPHKARKRLERQGEETPRPTISTDWTDIVAVAARHTVGLHKDGTVVAVGSNEYGQCDVSDWTDIVAVAAGRYHTVGLRRDGTVVAVGANGSGQCNVSGWTDIVAVASGDHIFGGHTVGLRRDGTVVAVGNNEDGQCDVSGWTDIVAVAAGSTHTVGLRKDGTVVAVGYNGDGRCDVSEWRDILVPIRVPERTG